MTKKTTDTLKMVGLVFMMTCFSLVLFNGIVLKTFSLNLTFFALLGATYYFSNKFRKNALTEFLLLLPAFIGMLMIILQDMGKLPFQIDLQVFTVTLYCLNIGNVLHRKEGEDE